MARDLYINGETLVKVKGTDDSPIGDLSELGLAEGPIRVIPRFAHRDWFVDDFGTEVPVEVFTRLADATILMTLVHYDDAVLEACVIESLGGSADGTQWLHGTLAGAGIPMGGNQNRFLDGNHYISLNLLSPVADYPWRFYFTHLLGPPQEIPLGTKRSAVRLAWRAVPYTFAPTAADELSSDGVVLWDHVLDI